MKTIIAASLSMMVALTGVALGQSRTTDQRPPQRMEQDGSNDLQRDRQRVLRQQSDLMAGPADQAAVAAVGKSRRSFGPDLMALVFAPVGIIVKPITEGLHVVDAAIAPINVALRPLTGPLSLPGEAAVVPVAVPVSGPRK